MTSLARAFRRHAAVASLLLLATAASGCEDDVTYSYFRVKVLLDTTDIDYAFIKTVFGCAVVVQTPHGSDTADFRCPTDVVEDLGTFDYSTSITSGSVTFSVWFTDINVRQIAKGVSAPMPIAQGQTTEGQVVVMKLATTNP